MQSLDQPWKTPFAFWITNWTDLLEFGEGLSDSMGLMEVSGFGCNLYIYIYIY